MATYSQLLAEMGAKQRQRHAETYNLLGGEIAESESLQSEGERLYQEATDKTGRQTSKYQEQGELIDLVTTGVTMANPIAGALLGLGLRSWRKKPTFNFDLSKALPEFEGRLFGKQKGLDLLSSIEGTRDIVHDAFKNTLLANLIGTRKAVGAGYAASDSDEGFWDWLRGIETEKESDDEEVEEE